MRAMMGISVGAAIGASIAKPALVVEVTARSPPEKRTSMTPHRSSGEPRRRTWNTRSPTLLREAGFTRSHPSTRRTGGAWTHVFALLLVLPGLSWPEAARAQTVPTEGNGAQALGQVEPMLAPGDVIRIEIWRQPELSGDFDVATDGTIRHPLYQDVQVAGMPLSQARERLHRFLTDFVGTPQFVITPLARVAIGGEVHEPNLYNLPPEISITEALAGAGGPTEDGRLDRVRLLRSGAELELDLTRPDRQYANMAVRSGDQILVGRRSNVWREYIAPAASMTGAAAAIITAIIRARN